MRFQGYFKEHVVESRLENARVRKVTIFYYLEDKSIMVTEPKVVNSGTPQGAFLKRQMVVKQDGSQSPFMPNDFGIGTDVSIFGRVMRIYDCDDYTRQFFAVSEIHIPLILNLNETLVTSVTRWFSNLNLKVLIQST